MEERFRVLLEQGIKTLEEIEEDIERERLEKEFEVENILGKVKELCSRLTADYYRDNINTCRKLIANQIDLKTNKLKLNELTHYRTDEFFSIDPGRKYYKVVSPSLEENNSLDTHCFVDIFTGEVYPPQSQTSPNRRRSYDLDKCISIADWRGYYLKDVPED